MAKAYHLICRKAEGKPIGMTHLGNGRWRSIAWEIAHADAAQLQGGWVYFHLAKSQASYFGGVSSTSNIWRQ